LKQSDVLELVARVVTDNWFQSW